MKIRHCPGCAQLVHYEASRPIQRCWNCALTTDFSLIQTLEQRFGWWLLGGIEVVVQSPFFSFARIARLGKVALVVALPVAVLMLLLCNSFDVRVVHDLSASFSPL